MKVSTWHTPGDGWVKYRECQLSLNSAAPGYELRILGDDGKQLIVDMTYEEIVALRRLLSGESK